MRKIVGIFSAFLLALLLAFSASAEEASHLNTATDAVGFGSLARLFDGKRSTYTSAEKEGVITLSREEGIAHLYIEFDRLPAQWTLTDPASGKSALCGKNTFLHEYVDVSALLGESPKQVELRFQAGTAIADVYAFSAGTLPQWVQIWQPPCKEADLMLISSHSDDEQLFFAGVLPYYAVERQLRVQVVYIVQHFEVYGEKEHTRPHEQLDGLWTVGVRNYPVMSDFPDVYSESKDRATAFKAAEKAFANAGVTYDDFCGYITECIRRFKPLVVVSHDLNGEYGHGTHVFCAAALTESIGFAADAARYPESAEAYGTWAPEKTYLHLYEENPIVMDWDTPLKSLGGKTPFQVTQEGFGCHKSQHWTWFNRWIYGSGGEITKATQIKTYSPCRYGLFDTKVGADVIGGDFMEHITTYREREEAAAAEAAKKAEEERLAQLEAEKKAAEEQAAAKARKQKKILLFAGSGAVLLAAAGTALLYKKRKGGRVK